MQASYKGSPIAFQHPPTKMPPRVLRKRHCSSLHLHIQSQTSSTKPLYREPSMTRPLTYIKICPSIKCRLLARAFLTPVNHSRTNHRWDHKSGTSSEKTITKKVSQACPANPWDDISDVCVVERRRREVINEGIENLAKLIPSPDKNKGAILTSACRYIQDLQQKIEAFDNERRIFDLTQQELTKRNEALRESAQRSWQETAKWMGRCKEHGLQYDDYDISVGANEALDESTAANMTGAGDGGTNAGYSTGGVGKADNSLS